MKPLTLSVLRLLADGQFHPGHALAAQLGVSRASIWHALQNVDALGCELYRIRGRGYRLAQPLAWLDVDTLQAALYDTPWHIQVHDSLPSTNRWALQQSRSLPHGTVIAAEWQTSGRGRRGRMWQAALGGSLLFSVVWRFSLPPQYLSGLSLAVGSVLAEVIAAAGVEAIQLKYPNDLLRAGGKVGGILIESQSDGESTMAVIGIGLNIRLPKSVRVHIDQTTNDLHGLQLNRSEFFVALLRALAVALPQFSQHGFAAFRTAWLARHAHTGQAVVVTLPSGEQQHGVLDDVALDGTLLLRTSNGAQVALHSGDISLRQEAQQA